MQGGHHRPRPASISYGNWRLFPETQDEYGLALDRVRFVGDECGVAAIDRDTAVEAAGLIQGEYEELPACSTWMRP